MALAAIAGATQDIGSDGVYVTALPSKEQAKYTGFQSMCWNLGPILATGLLVRLSGTFHDKTGSWATAWMIIMLISAAIIFVMALLPRAHAADGIEGARRRRPASARR